jgi:hypothetical protein
LREPRSRPNRSLGRLAELRQQGGVDYAADISFSLHQSLRVGEVTTVVTNGVGSGSDGSRVRMHDVIHVTIDAGRNVVRSFERGAAECT